MRKSAPVFFGWCASGSAEARKMGLARLCTLKGFASNDGV
jgi:hypothetical protein